MTNREEFNACLVELIGNDHVYFQPPENLRIKYPCVIYSLDGLFEPKADNIDYSRRRKYEILYITHDPDDLNIEKISDLPFCSMKRPYVADNLHHYPYTIYI